MPQDEVRRGEEMEKARRQDAHCNDSASENVLSSRRIETQNRGHSFLSVHVSLRQYRSRLVRPPTPPLKHLAPAVLSHERPESGRGYSVPSGTKVQVSVRGRKLALSLDSGTIWPTCTCLRAGRGGAATDASRKMASDTYTPKVVSGATGQRPKWGGVAT